MHEVFATIFASRGRPENEQSLVCEFIARIVDNSGRNYVGFEVLVLEEKPRLSLRFRSYDFQSFFHSFTGRALHFLSILLKNVGFRSRCFRFNSGTQ